jgi:hypothetical protein
VAGPVADIDEDDPSEIAEAVDPAKQRHVGADIVDAEGATRVGSGEISERFSH